MKNSANTPRTFQSHPLAYELNTAPGRVLHKSVEYEHFLVVLLIFSLWWIQSVMVIILCLILIDFIQRTLYTQAYKIQTSISFACRLVARLFCFDVSVGTILYLIT